MNNQTVAQGVPCQYCCHPGGAEEQSGSFPSQQLELHSSLYGKKKTINRAIFTLGYDADQTCPVMHDNALLMQYH